MARHSAMDDYCEQAGCSEKQRKNHAWKWEKRRWHSHPIPTFREWFEPHGVDPQSGASVGGHPESRRIWARKDPGRWLRRWYGLPTEDGWNTAWVVGEFNAWVEAGRPQREEDFISIAATLERQKAFWHDYKPLASLLGSGCKPEQIEPMVRELNRKYPGEVKPGRLD